MEIKGWIEVTGRESGQKSMVQVSKMQGFKDGPAGVLLVENNMVFGLVEESYDEITRLINEASQPVDQGAVVEVSVCDNRCPLLGGMACPLVFRWDQASVFKFTLGGNDFELGQVPPNGCPLSKDSPLTIKAVDK